MAKIFNGVLKPWLFTLKEREGCNYIFSEHLPLPKIVSLGFKALNAIDLKL